MDDKEKLKFLQKMGFSVSRLGDSEADKAKKAKRENFIEKSDLVALARKFDVAPAPQKTQSLDEFLNEQGGK